MLANIHRQLQTVQQVMFVRYIRELHWYWVDWSLLDYRETPGQFLCKVYFVWTWNPIEDQHEERVADKEHMHNKSSETITKCLKGNGKGGRRMQRYCTTGQGASGPEGSKGGGEESFASSDRPLVSSQPCQQEPVIQRQRWGRDSEEQQEEGKKAGKCSVSENWDEKSCSKSIRVCLHVCRRDIPQDKAGPGLEDPALPSGPLDLSFPLLLCHPGHDDDNTHRHKYKCEMLKRPTTMLKRNISSSGSVLTFSPLSPRSPFSPISPGKPWT